LEAYDRKLKENEENAFKGDVVFKDKGVIPYTLSRIDVV